MKIDAIITDVTRMRAPKVCIAALHEDRAIRLDTPQPTEHWVRSLGGLNPGDVVSLGWQAKPGATAPHREDGEWEPASFRRLNHLTEDKLVKHLASRADDSVRAAFGDPWFLGTAGNAAFRPGSGRRSLASIRAQTVEVYPHFEGIRVDFRESQDAWTRVPLEDLIVRQHQRACRTCSSRLSALLAGEFQGGRAILRVGLSRPFRTPQYPPACWMQVNHIFLIPSRRKHFALSLRSSP